MKNIPQTIIILAILAFTLIAYHMTQDNRSFISIILAIFVLFTFEGDNIINETEDDDEN